MLVLDKTYMPGYFRTGRILESMDKRELALEVFERGVRYARKMLVLDKTYMPGYFRNGRILESMDKRELALEVFERGSAMLVKLARICAQDLRKRYSLC